MQATLSDRVPRGLGLLVGLLFALAVATPADAVAVEAPRWNIIATSSPTNLAPNSPRNEAQDVAVNATGGTFTLATAPRQGVPASPCNKGIPQSSAPIAGNATAPEVQSALEAIPCVGSGGVTVGGGPGGVTPYVVTFVGEHENRPVPLMAVDSSGLSGGSASAAVTEAVRGAFAPSITVTAINVGGAATDGSPIALNDVLPASLTATAISGYDAYASALAENGEGGAAMSCSAPPTLSCSYSGTVDPGDMLTMTITLKAGESFAPNVNDVTISGGGAAEAAAGAPIVISDTPANFGPASGSVMAAISSNQAGAHANLTTAFTLATSEPDALPAEPRDIRFDLPPGLVGNTVGMPRCTMGNILNLEKNPKGCPSDTMVGMAVVTVNTQEGAGGGDGSRVVPVFNIAPSPGEPAAFGFDAIKLLVRLDTSLLSDGNYGVRVTAPGLTEASSSLAAAITTWGIPADHSGPGNDKSLFDLFSGESFGGANPGETRAPLLTNPQQCSEGLSAEMSADSWTNPGAFVSSGPVPMGTLEGCDRLSLESSFTMLPDTLEAGAPAGYSFDLNLPQHNEPDGLATPNIKRVKLTLPTGVVISPSAATGLRACSDAQFFGANRGRQEPASPAECPREAQVGTVRVETPALEEPLEGELYLGEPECGRCTPEDAQDGRMVRLFLQVVGEGEKGIVVKLAGRGQIDQQTGQITTTFENNPQLPFSALQLELRGGSRAPLANPRQCGPANTNLDLTPWNTPFGPDSTPSYGFEVSQGCFGPQFSPSFVAGLSNLQAGAYGPFSLSFGRGDRDQFLSGLEVRMPPGLLGSLAHVPLCTEPQAAQGTCGQASRIGHTEALTGPGASPFLDTGGQVFLTDGYKGAPFGLSIVVPSVAGPYTLSGTTGNGTVVVRATVSVDRSDAHVTIKSDPLPTELDGIPLQLKALDTTIDRPEFIFGPTNCSKLAIRGTLSSSEAASAAVSSPFQVANCSTLAFRPKFTALAQAKTSKADGASLHVKVAYPKAPFGSQANIGKVKVDLPKQLPSRLTTLQKACTAAVFEANPAACPPASVVGQGTAATPVLKNLLKGPAYLVSHGGEAFPDLVIVLQGEGITFDLVGNTDITKGITSSTFKAVPDAPVSTFDLVLPEGPHSVLTTNLPAKAKRSLCGQSLAMPTAITGQNGAVIKQTTKIAVSGCPKHRATKKAKKARKSPAKRKRHGKGRAQSQRA
jgi:hypothetical protein